MTVPEVLRKCRNKEDVDFKNVRSKRHVCSIVSKAEKLSFCEMFYIKMFQFIGMTHLLIFSLPKSSPLTMENVDN